MLSRPERERLAEIEDALTAQDPGLADKFDQLSSGPGVSSRKKLLITVLLVLSGLLAVVFLAADLVPAGVLLGLLTAAGAAVSVHHFRRTPHP